MSDGNTHGRGFVRFSWGNESTAHNETIFLFYIYAREGYILLGTVISNLEANGGR